MRRFPVLALALALPVLGCNVDSGAGSDPFQQLNHEQALARARSEKKVVMIDFYSDTCPPCRQLDAETFTDRRVRTFLQERTVAVRLRIEDNQQLARMYRIAFLPCLVFVSGEGEEVGRMLGVEPPDAFLAKAREIVN
jgi:thiol:disulfide interchange protein DsbD